ncbi:DMT family transporter [Streptomyces sp. NPDC060194]|uniref:DMT family transporter n=1 Tax=Streptomyces sp. NPDC060194 TaxID=3347069 RepID=UPI00365BFD5E
MEVVGVADGDVDEEVVVAGEDAGVLLAALGAFLVVRNGAEVGGSSRWTGDVLLLLGGLAWAGYNVLGKRASEGQDALGVTYHQTVAGAAGFLLASLVEAGEWRVPDAEAASLLVHLAVACSVGGFLLYNYGLRRMPSSVAVSILNLVPVFGVLGAVLINGESVTLAQAAGGVVIVAGVVIGMIERPVPPAAAPVPGPAEPRDAARSAAG